MDKNTTNFTSIYIPEYNKIIIGNNYSELFSWDFDFTLLYSIDKISNINSDASHRTFRMRLDAHCCALGKVMLAYRPENEISSIYKSYNFY